MPDELRAVAEAKRALEAATAVADRTPPSAEAVAVARFEALLGASGVSMDDDWESAMKKIINQPDYAVLPTLAERKACFERWREARQLAAKEEAQAAHRRKKVQFLSLLREEASSITSRTRYSSASERLAADPRWRALDVAADEREELYEEFCSSLQRKEEKERAAERQQRLAAAKQLFASEKVGVDAQWRKVHAALSDAPEMQAIDKLDRLAAFEEYIKGLEEEEAQAREAARASQRRVERKKRDAFRTLLAALWDGTALESGEPLRLTPVSVWREVLPAVEVTDAYKGCLDQPGSSPQDLFDDFMETKRDEYKGHKRRLTELVERAGGLAPAGAPADAQTLPAPLATSVDEFEVALRGADDAGLLAAVPGWAVAHFHAELAEEAAREMARIEESIRAAERRSIEAFQGALRGLMGATLTSTTSWETVAITISGKAFAESLAEPLQRRAFDELIGELSADEAREAARDDDAAEAARADDDERRRHKRERRERRRAEEGEEQRGEDGEVDGSSKKRKREKREKKEKRERRSEREAGEASEEEGVL